MRFCSSRLVAPLACVYVAFGLFFGIHMRPAAADSVPRAADISSASTQDGQVTPWTSLADLKSQLDHIDRLAVLEAIHVGLSDAPDGATYMWRRHNGKIAGSVRPTTSYRDAEGKVCRHLVFQLLLGEHMRQIEGVACRQTDRSWLLEG